LVGGSEGTTTITQWQQAFNLLNHPQFAQPCAERLLVHAQPFESDRV
jgi:hypothetical protein